MHFGSHYFGMAIWCRAGTISFREEAEVRRNCLDQASQRARHMAPI